MHHRTIILAVFVASLLVATAPPATSNQGATAEFEGDTLYLAESWGMRLPATSAPTRR